MATLQSPALTGSPNSISEQAPSTSRSPSFEVPSPSTPDPQKTSPINMNNATSNRSGTPSGSNQGGSASGGKKDDGILDAFLPRVESRGQSRQAAPKKDDSKSKGQSNP